MSADMQAMLAVMLQRHIQTYGPLPDELGEDARAALTGDSQATLRLAAALADIEAEHQEYLRQREQTR